MENQHLTLGSKKDFGSAGDELPRDLYFQGSFVKQQLPNRSSRIRISMGPPKVKL